MSSPIVVTGGTGTLGGHVVPLLLGRGRTVRIVSRHEREAAAGIEYVVADLSDAASVPVLAESMRATSVVMHLAGSSKGDDGKTRNLLDAIRATRSKPHLVYISVVGADRTPVVSAVDRAMFGYVAAKRASESLIKESGLPYTILRATQFHELMVTTARAMSRLPVVVLPSRTRMQPVDGHEVAERLVDLALSEPAGVVDDMAGPTIYGIEDLVRSYLTHVGKRRPIVGVRMPGRAAAAFRGGANTAPAHAVGLRTWERYLTETAASR